MDRLVAIKMMQSHLLGDEEALKRFQREARAVSALEHPNIVKVYGFGSYEGQPYMAIEYLQGTSLADLLKVEHRLPCDKALPIFTAICDALSHAHERGIVHRDLKPSNVMLVGQDSQVKLVDFGIAKFLPTSGKEAQQLTRTGAMVGTALYMSPGQVYDKDVDARADIYSMGCLMYEVLAGEPAFAGNTPYEIMAKHMSEPPPSSPYIKDELGRVVHACMEKDRDLRPQSAKELKAALLDPNSFKGGSRKSSALAARKVRLAPGGLLFTTTIVAAVLSTSYFALSRLAAHDPAILDSQPAVAPKDIDCRALLSLGVTEHKNHRWKAAEGYLSEAIARSLNNSADFKLDNEKLIQAKFWLALTQYNDETLSNDQRRKMTIPLFDDVIHELEPRAKKAFNADYLVSLKHRAKVYQQLGNCDMQLDSALKDVAYCQTFVQDPDVLGPEVGDLGIAYYFAGRYKEAIMTLKRSLSLLLSTERQDDGFALTVTNYRTYLAEAYICLSKHGGTAKDRQIGMDTINLVRATIIQWPDGSSKKMMEKRVQTILTDANS
jgi:serine/threonine protein kinase